jgi:UPF0716 family protein affecting phage T7 exclusion
MVWSCPRRLHSSLLLGAVKPGTAAVLFVLVVGLAPRVAVVAASALCGAIVLRVSRWRLMRQWAQR